MAKDVDFNKVIWEGWTTGDFIEELQAPLAVIMNGQSWRKPITSLEELKKWCIDNQSYYKKYIPDVVNHFAVLYGIR